MSIIFGIWNRDGRAVEPDQIEAMRGGLQACAHDGIRVVTLGNVAFGRLSTQDTAEAVHERTPLHLPEHGLLFVAEGRLDNRDELAAALGVKAGGDVPDGDLMALSYLRWGADAPKRLLGDWSLAAFHQDRRELFLARDHHGATGLDYHLADDFVAFSSNVRALVALDRVPKRPNPEAVARLQLTWSGGDPFQGYYRDIQHLRAAHTLSVGATTPAPKRYWFPEEIRPRERADLRESVQELRALLESAIAARLRAAREVASTLSGGLDSSTVSYIAAELLGRQGARLPTFSHVPLHEPSRTLQGERIGDEGPLIRAVVEASGRMDPRFLDSRSISLADGIRQFLDLCHAPIHAAPNAFWLIDLTRSAAGEGADALLNGSMGNATISFQGMPDLLPWRFVRSAWGMKRVVRQKVLRPAYRAGRALVRGKAPAPDRAPRRSYLNAPTLAELGFFGRMEEEGFNPRAPQSFGSSQEFARAIMMIGSHPRGYYDSHLGDRFGVGWRDPTADVRVLEYALSLPNELFFDPQGNGKNVVRNMMRGHLPDAVLDAKLKGLQSADMGLRAMDCQHQIDELLDEVAHSATAGAYLDLPALREDWLAVKEVRDNRYDYGAIHPILRAAMVGLFLTRFG